MLVDEEKLENWNCLEKLENWRSLRREWWWFFGCFVLVLVVIGRVFCIVLYDFLFLVMYLLV